MEVIFFTRPNGNQIQGTIEHVKGEDAKWFKENNVKVSMEDCGIFLTIYADCGLFINNDPTEDPDEIIVITNADEKCEDALTRLRIECEQALEKRK